MGSLLESSDIPWWTFTVYNVAGVLFWTCAWGLGSYYLGRDVQDIAAFSIAADGCCMG